MLVPLKSMRIYAYFFIISIFQCFADSFSNYQHLHPPDLPKGKNRMMGNWNGIRTKMENQGISFISSYAIDLVGNPVGGQARGFAYAGSFGIGMQCNFEKLCSIPNLEFFISATWRSGTNLSERKIKNQFAVQQLYGTETVQLSEMYFKRTFFDSKWVIKGGRLCAGDDFLQSDLYYLFVNNAFDDNPVGVFYNMGLSAYPTSTWGIFTSFEPTEKISVKMGVYNTNSNLSKNKYHGLNFTFKSTSGTLWITEWDYRTNIQQMRGSYRAGFIYQTGWTQNKFNGNLKGDYSYYLLIDQMVYQPKSSSDRGVIPFIALLFAPKDRNLFPFFTIGGTVFKGPFPSREKDALAFGIAYGKYSSDIKPKRQIGETVIELNYSYEWNDWCVITPDLQYIIHPRGLSNIPNAFCVGLQTSFAL